ncbi:hypothetical protein HUJ04_005157 [Dendroctonus ponderosae]|nr:hypothetical protein HUJ04_005157 [Dendroctonus ponderosae]
MSRQSMVKVQNLIKDIEKRLRFYGHVRRMGEEGLPLNILKWKPPEKKQQKDDRANNVETRYYKSNVRQEEWKSFGG